MRAAATAETVVEALCVDRVHDGGGVGIGNSIHAGMVVLADGSDDAGERLQRVLTTDPGMGVVRHLDAGYPEAQAAADEHGLTTPMRGT